MRRRKRAAAPLTIECPERHAVALLHLVVERLCEIRENWSREANAERERLKALRAGIEDAVAEHRQNQGGDRQLRKDNEDWRSDPCRCCKTVAMLWWRFCPFCGTQLPTVLDGRVAEDARRARRSPAARRKRS